MTISRWNPQRTRAFITCIAQFEGSQEPDFSIEDRLDPALIAKIISGE